MLTSLCLALLGWITSPLPLTVIALTLVYLYHFVTENYDFWLKRGVPGPRAVLPWGNEFGVPGIGGLTYSDFENWIYSQLNGGKFCGFVELRRPVLYVADLDLISAITVRDFEHFTNRRNRTTSPVYNRMVAFLSGKELKKTRTELSKTFSTGKIKGMVPLCVKTADNLRQHLSDEREKGAINMKHAFVRFTMDTIASVAFGVECNSFNNDNTELIGMAAAFFKVPGTYGKVWSLCSRMLPSWIAAILPDPYTKVRKYFDRITEETLRKRKATGVTRRDFLQLLLEAKDENGNRCFTDYDIVTHCLTFYLSGHDTTANILAFAACALATVPSCQEEAHREIDAVLERHGGQLTYEALAELQYLERVILETTRMYPPALHLERLCTKEYTLPGTKVHIPVGTLVEIPVFPIHRDPQFYPEPLRFNPDRFLPEEREKRPPNTYLAFGAGPRECLARRFAFIEAKVALVAVLKEFQLLPGPNTPPPPLPLDPGATIACPHLDHCFVKVVPRKNL